MDVQAGNLAVGQIYEFNFCGAKFTYKITSFWNKDEVVYQMGEGLFQTKIETFLLAINTDAMEVKRVR